ncbi:MAG: hypothetical protein RMM30_02055 [Armatimonadota bacterium]|nr:hypothetical protein [Armatimonadota bacterium]MDW8155356.1 hypothetical protein [Armatimonadota bacterium]
MWTALATSFTVGLLATVAVNRRRWKDFRVWVAFGVGGVAFVGVQFVARPMGALLGQLGGGELPAWPVVAVLVGVAEVFKLTGALALHQLYRMNGAEAGSVGAAVGAGFGAWSESVVLRSALQVAQMGLPGGVSLASAVAASVPRLLAHAGSTGLATRLAASGRTAAGLALAAAAQLLLDPLLRVVALDPRWVLALTAVVGVGLFAVLWLPGRRAEG